MGRPKKNATAVSNYIHKKVQALEGLDDITGENEPLWGLLLRRLSRLWRTYGFERAEVPLLEDFRLYELYYKDEASRLEELVRLEAGGKAAVLRADFLPAILRSYYQNKIYEKSPLSKWSWNGFCVKQGLGTELVSDYQFGCELFGQFSHLTEAQMIGGVWEFLQSLGLKDSQLEVNHIGSPESQEAYSQTLREFLVPKKNQLCDWCGEQLDGRVLNALRCDNLDCQAIVSEAPAILDFLDETSRRHFTATLEALDELAIPYQLNPLYAGPAGFGRTNLVIKYKTRNHTVVLGEGGYHEQLMQLFCGKPYQAFGFSGSLSKIHGILESAKTVAAREQKNDVFLVPLGELAAKRALRLFRDLSGERISVYDHFGNAGVKNQLKQAEMYNAPIALIMGQKEAMDEMVILRDVKSGMQEVISYDKIVQEVKKRLGK